MKQHSFSIVTGLFQICLVILFWIFVEYDSIAPADNNSLYPLFQDVHVMIFVGIGFLYSFLKKYSFGAIGYNMFIAALVLQWATLMRGWMRLAFSLDGSYKIKLNLESMLNADFATATVLITFGTVLGKVGRLQLVVLGVIEIIFFYLNECVIVKYLQITDAGASILIHIFAAFFGLALTRMVYRKDHRDDEREGSNYTSDVFAMLGTLFLWLFWPSFNGSAVTSASGKQRALINTYFSMAACCVTVFVVSPLVHKKQKIDMVHVQNATLAGGVAVGTCANLMIGPWGAILLGMAAGVISVLGFAYVQPALLDKLKIHDTCGVNNLHGMPGILAAVAGAIASATATFDTYGQELFTIWDARTPSVNSTLYYQAIANNIKIGAGGLGRSASMQGIIQAIAMVVTIVISIVSGLLTGLIIRYIDVPEQSQLFDDADFWIQAEEGENETSSYEKGHLLANTEA